MERVQSTTYLQAIHVFVLLRVSLFTITITRLSLSPISTLSLYHPRTCEHSNEYKRLDLVSLLRRF